MCVSSQAFLASHPKSVCALPLSRLRSALAPEDGGMPGPQFAPMVVVVRCVGERGRAALSLCLAQSLVACTQGELNSEGGMGMGLLSWWPEE